MKLAISLCPNDIFVFSGLILKEIPNDMDISVYSLGELNQLLIKDTFDFIKVSSIALIRNSSYQITRVGASLTKNKGPQLVKAKGKSVDGNLLGVPSLQATATKLAQRYFPQLELKEIPLNQLSNEVKNGNIPYAIIINEDMNRLEQLGLESICDLGLKWNDEFNALLPLGVIGAKSVLSESEVSKFEKLVNKSIQWAKDHQEEAIELTKKYTGSTEINSDHIELFTQDAHLNPKIPEYLDKLATSIPH